MRAEEATELTSKALEVDMSAVFAAIKTCAKAGKSECFIYTIKQNQLEYALTDLKANGYEARIVRNNDQRDPGDYLLVKW